MFVWALVFSGLRYHQSASIECNGATQKIHMRKFSVGQGLVGLMENDRFHDQRPLDKQNGSVRAHGSALTRNGDIPHGSKNLLQRVIQKIYVCQGRLQAISR